MFETDKTLVKRFVNGDEEAFTVLANKWRDHILNFSYQFLGNEEMARDVLQEVLLRLYLSLKKFCGKAKFSTFLFRIIKNCCIDTHRKNRNKAKEISFEDLNQNIENKILFENTSIPVISAISVNLIWEYSFMIITKRCSSDSSIRACLTFSPRSSQCTKG